MKAQGKASNKPLILLVDDDRDVLEIAERILAAKGYRTLCFSDPNEALDQMRKEKPDLVVTDLMMGDLDEGFSFSRKIKEDDRLKDVPVVILTGIAGRLGLDFRPRNADDLAAMGADAFLEKPIAPGALLEKIEKLLGQRLGKDKA